MKVGFVCTNYNNSSFTRSAIASLRRGGQWNDVRVAVVDNHSEAGDIEHLQEIQREFPGIEVLLNPENVGYFPGLNIGIRHLRSRFPEIEHLVVGNNDLEFTPDFVEAVQRHRDVLDTWAVVAPDLVTLDGIHQNPHVLHPVSQFRRWIWDMYFVSYVSAALIRQVARLTRRFTVRAENTPDSDLYCTPGPIEQGYGACYLLGPEFFRHFTGLCAPTFVMQEEFFLSEQLKTIGQMTYYDPRFVVHHAGHATMGRVPSHRHWEISRDAHRIYKEYLRMLPAEQRRLIGATAKFQATEDMRKGYHV